jgi:hypothetical protein
MFRPQDNYIAKDLAITGGARRQRNGGCAPGKHTSAIDGSLICEA